MYIGEEGLDISDCVSSDSTIGWWASAAQISTTAPTKTISLYGRVPSFTVAPSDFFGYTGNWYLLNADGTTVKKDNSGVPIRAFIVADPCLDMSIWDMDTNSDVPGRSVPLGEHLTFLIKTNMIINPVDRPNANPATDGFINVRVKDETGAMLDTLYDSGSTLHSLLNQYIGQQPRFWPNGGGTPVYQLGN